MIVRVQRQKPTTTQWNDSDTTHRQLVASPDVFFWYRSCKQRRRCDSSTAIFYISYSAHHPITVSISSFISQEYKWCLTAGYLAHTKVRERAQILRSLNYRNERTREHSELQIFVQRQRRTRGYQICIQERLSFLLQIQNLDASKPPPTLVHTTHHHCTVHTARRKTAPYFRLAGFLLLTLAPFSDRTNDKKCGNSLSCFPVSLRQPQQLFPLNLTRLNTNGFVLQIQTIFGVCDLVFALWVWDYRPKSWEDQLE